MNLLKHTILGMVSGILLGLFFSDVARYISFIGVIYLTLIKTLAAPIVFFSLVTTLPSIKIQQYYLIVRFIKISLILTILVLLMVTIVAYLLDLSNVIKYSTSDIIYRKELLLSSNHNLKSIDLTHAFASNTFLQLIFLAITVSTTLGLLGKKSKIILDKLKLLRHFLFKIVSLVIKFSPYGIASLIASSISVQKASLLFLTSKIIISLIISYTIYYIILSVIITKFGKTSSAFFLKNSLKYQLEAFVSGSSKISLPTALAVIKNKMGVPKKIADLILPLASSTNMQGLSIYMSVISLALIQLSGQEITLSYFMNIALFSTIGSIGAAGINGGALIILPSLLVALQIPKEYISIIYMIEPIMSGLRSATNITSDAVITLLVDKSNENFLKNTNQTKGA